MNVEPRHSLPLRDLAGTPVLVGIREMCDQLVDASDVVGVMRPQGGGIWRISAIGGIDFVLILGSGVLVGSVRHLLPPCLGQTVEPLTHDLKFRLSAKPLLYSLSLC